MSLPIGWTEGTADDGRVFYQNPAIGTTWTRPVHLPSEWAAALDPVRRSLPSSKNAARCSPPAAALRLQTPALPERASLGRCPSPLRSALPRAAACRCDDARVPRAVIRRCS